MKTYRIVLSIVALLPLLASAGLAEQKPQEPEKGPLVKVQVVLSRYEGDRKTSSLPFTVLATANGDRVSIRTGAQVPMSNGLQTSADKPSFNYVDIGTNIDCGVKSAENGRYNLYLSINDRSVLEKPAASRGGTSTAVEAPLLRNFSYTNSILLKDGESKQFVAASDKVSGEVVKIDVTLNVEK
jgi:hypothetical protein